MFDDTYTTVDHLINGCLPVIRSTQALEEEGFALKVHIDIVDSQRSAAPSAITSSQSSLADPPLASKTGNRTGMVTSVRPPWNRKLSAPFQF